MKHEPTSALDLLVRELFDYAGMFPPASRSFEDALKESGSLSRSLTRPWMVAGDLVLDQASAERLLSENLSAQGFTAPLKLCLLASSTAQENLSTAEKILISAAGQGPPIKILSIEVRSSALDAPQTIEHYAGIVKDAKALLAIEPDLSTPRWEEELFEMVALLAQTPSRPAIKCRLTGPTGIGAAKLSSAIAATCDARIPLKITGGLHHPIVEKTRHEYSMGFLNVATSVMLRRSIGSAITTETISQLLINDDPHALLLGSDLGYREISISLSEARRAKESAHFSIGSCSLHEPDQDLARLFPSRA